MPDRPAVPAPGADPVYENVAGTCDCVYVAISSKACHKCGRRGIISAEALSGHLIDLAQYYYVLRQIAEGVPDAADMAARVLSGERSVRSREAAS